MALFAYFKAEPTEYVIASANGNVLHHGVGRSFWYWRPSTSIVLIPVATTDAQFIFHETTSNFQSVTLQGQVTYRVTDPQLLAGLLNFTINPSTRQYQTEDPAKLEQRLINIVQMHTRSALREYSLEDALRAAEQLARTVLTRIREEQLLTAMGIECLSLFYTSIKATPEMARALEADYREALQQREDQAIYARRAEAVEQERKIKQNELATAINLEQRRQELVALEGENARSLAEFASEATRIQLAPFSELEPRLLLALAFRDFAGNAQKIGNLTITSQLLEELLQAR